MQRIRGFTLIELMIVVAIIAIIAAIAIPSILRSRMSANQTSAIGSLDSILKMNTQFRSNDSERNGENDYWTENVWGLHGVRSAGGDEIELIPKTIAQSDWEGIDDDLDPTGFTVSDFSEVVVKSGYYVSMQRGADLDGDLSCSSPGTGEYGLPTNDNRFSSVAFPELYDNTGTKAFLIDESGTTWTVDAKTKLGSSNNMPFNGPGNSTGPDNPDAPEGVNPVQCRPTEDQIDSTWSTTGS